MTPFLVHIKLTFAYQMLLFEQKHTISASGILEAIYANKIISFSKEKTQLINVNTSHWKK